MIGGGAFRRLWARAEVSEALEVVADMVMGVKVVPGLCGLPGAGERLTCCVRRISDLFFRERFSPALLRDLLTGDGR